MLNLNIAVVLNPHFGSRLIELAQRLHVWVCSSPDNLPAVQATLAIPELYETGRGVTTFSKCGDPEAVFLSNLDTIDLHHPYWRVIEVYGLAATPQVQEALRAYGAADFNDFTDGFIATRSEQQD
jgi:hypothetical protein